MVRRTAGLAAAALLAGAAGTACGASGSGSASSSPQATATARPSIPPPSPSPSPSPLPTPAATPDTESVAVVETGVGAYLETTYPVAVLRSSAASHTARHISVHLAVAAGGRRLGAADVEVDALAPGASVPVATRVQAPATAGETVTATVAVGGWDDGSAAPVATAGPATFSCPRCGGGRASGDVLATLTLGSAVAPGSPLQLVSICRSAAGGIVGGGSQLFVPPAGATTGVQADVPTVVSSHPATCEVAAWAGGL